MRSCVVDVVVVITFKFENMHLAFLRSLNSGFFFLNKCLYMQSKKEVSNDLKTFLALMSLKRSS